ncbi:MAG: hypothetical protein HC884_19190, partial [Chloroflexaceae bacterium]|nr:hypothetical protein [Chloroflexaceae bacterium]
MNIVFLSDEPIQSGRTAFRARGHHSSLVLLVVLSILRRTSQLLEQTLQFLGAFLSGPASLLLRLASLLLGAG